MKAGNGAPPERAVPERELARYGIRWRARDLWRAGGMSVARHGRAGALGRGWAAIGVVLLLALLFLPPAPLLIWAEAAAFVVAGAALCAGARLGRRR
jgi:hypothetical protein